MCILYIYTSAGRKFALAEGLSHDLESVPDRFFMSILHGRCGTVKLSPGSKFNKLRRYSQGKSDQNHVNKRIPGGKGLQYEDSTSTTFVQPVYICVWCPLYPSNAPNVTVEWNYSVLQALCGVEFAIHLNKSFLRRTIYGICNM